MVDSACYFDIFPNFHTGKYYLKIVGECQKDPKIAGEFGIFILRFN